VETVPPCKKRRQIRKGLKPPPAAMTMPARSTRGYSAALALQDAAVAIAS
jgi:hypothetical protein